VGITRKIRVPPQTDYPGKTIHEKYTKQSKMVLIRSVRVIPWIILAQAEEHECQNQALP